MMTMPDNPEDLEALLASVKGPDGRVQLDGTRVATSAQLRAIALTSKLEGFERQFDQLTVERLDPDGQHIVCIRPTMAFPDAPITEHEDGRLSSPLNITLGTPIPCEVMVKFERTKAPNIRLLDIRLYDLLKLKAIGTEYTNREQRRKKERQARDGQRRKSW